LVVRSRGIWDALEAESGTELITRTGAIDHGDARHVSQLAEIFEAVGVAHEIVDPARAAGRWRQFAFDTAAPWPPDAGVSDAGAPGASMLDLAHATGRARLITYWAGAEGARRSPGGFRVTSATGDVVDGDRVIVAAGGWLPDLLGDLGLPDGF